MSQLQFSLNDHKRRFQFVGNIGHQLFSGSFAAASESFISRRALEIAPNSSFLCSGKIAEASPFLMASIPVMILRIGLAHSRYHFIGYRQPPQCVNRFITSSQHFVGRIANKEAVREGLQMSYKLSIKKKQLIIIIHVLSVVCWLGGAMVMLLLVHIC